MSANVAMFEDVAAGKLSPSAAARMLLDADQKAREQRRPAWGPRWVWSAAAIVFALFLSFIGLRRSDDA